MLFLVGWFFYAVWLADEPDVKTWIAAVKRIKMLKSVASKKLFRDLKSGDRVVVDDNPETVESVCYGPGLCSFETKTAKPVLVTFASGRTLSRHPGNSISVLV